jgi:glycosyltransferase involved in cell wall biosynthesis
VHDGLQRLRTTRAQKAVTLGRSLARHGPATLATVARWARGAYRPLGQGLADALSADDRLWPLERQVRAALDGSAAAPATPASGPGGRPAGEAAWREALATMDEVRASAADAPIVALQVDAFDKGGLEEVVLTLARELRRNGAWRVVVLAAGPVGYLGRVARADGVPVIALHEDRELLGAVLRQAPIRLANLHYSTFGVEEWANAGVPILYTVHNAYIWSDPEWVRRRSALYRRMTGFVAVSEPVKDFFVSRFDVEAARVRTIPNGLDLAQADRVEPISRSELGVADADVVFLNVAAFNWYKSHLLMLAALERVVARCPRAKLVFVGSVQDEACMAAIRESIAKRGLAPHVRILEYMPKPRVLGALHAADCFLLPSLVEGWSIAAMEAMYAGIPLILSDVGSARAVIRDGDIGRIVPNRFPDLARLDMDVVRREHIGSGRHDNLDELVDAMLAICEDREGWRRRAAAGRERVVREYSSAKMGEAYAAAFRELIQETATSR